ncbi:hypothetical protein [Treponema denticola]|uniref:plasmid mobilization protein n=1 Tax=Treponema denticola TaxID=158 RepID=UPI003452F0EE
MRARVLGEPFKVITKDKSTEKHLRELSSIIASIQQIGILYNEAVKTLIQLPLRSHGSTNDRQAREVFRAPH